MMNLNTINGCSVQVYRGEIMYNPSLLITYGFNHLIVNTKELNNLLKDEFR